MVGAGAAGLCAVRHFARDSNYLVTAYEQTGDIGGTWIYNERTGLDEHGLPIHSSMYRDLRTNLPARIMNFPDFTRMTAEEPCCVTHEEVLGYLRNYADHFDLRKYIQFNTQVEDVRVQSDTGAGEQWSVRVKDLRSNGRTEALFDAIMICNGHYFDPFVPSIPGIESFPGTVMHSHSYRKPEGFSGKTVLILGAASSGIDIGIELSRHVPRVYLSHNNDRLVSPLPPNMSQVMGVERVDGGRLILRDGSSVTADVLLFCTGYRFSFPFLDESCGIRVDQNHVTPLYKHLINIEHPTMCIVGVPTVVVPFPMFHIQIQYFLALLEKKATLPSKTEMLEDSKLKTVKKRHAHKLMDKQWSYNDSLAIAGDFPCLPDYYRLGYEVWAAQRKTNLLDYKNSKFLVSDDGRSVQLITPNLTKFYL